jgi:DUF4097 and DUF4098 domain-containing protein YvlB
MPTFDTPEPISVNVEIRGFGDIRIVAADRADTQVEVRPRDATKKPDVNGAAQTQVEYQSGRLTIQGPRASWQYLPLGMGAVRCSGRLGECRVKTGMGEIQLDQAGPVRLGTGLGDITVGEAAGEATIRTGSGTIRIDSITGPAEIRNSNGDNWIGEVTGDLLTRSSNGRISVDRADASVTAKTACGSIRLFEVARGSVVADSGAGKLEVGVSAGVAAWLDLDARHGRVQSELDAAQPPAPGEERVEIRAHTGYGDITVRRVAPLTGPLGTGGEV